MQKLIVLLTVVLIPIYIMFVQERMGTTIINRIKSEAVQNSQVIDNVFYLNDVYGPRLTGSPAYKAAGDWIINLLHDYKLDNIQKEELNWGRGWSYKKFGFYLMEPYTASLIASPGTWSSGTQGFVQGEPFLAPAPTDWLQDSYEKYVHDYKGKLKGKFVLMSPPRSVQPQLNPLFHRFTDEELLQLSNAPISPASTTLSDSIYQEFHKWGIKFNQFLLDEGIAGLVYQSRGDAGMVVSFGPYWARETTSKIPPTFFLAAEYYNQILRLLQRNIPVLLGAEMETNYYNDASNTFNITAEIQGKSKKDEIVMIGAHLDSWTGASGAIDNSAQSNFIYSGARTLSIGRAFIGLADDENAFFIILLD